jgi:hypothetical protein
VVEHELHELVPGFFAAALLVGGRRSVNRRSLDVLVARERVHVGAAFEQDACGIDVAEEAGEPERVKPVVTERLGQFWVVLEQLAHSIRSTESGRLEDRELLPLGNPLGLVSVSAIEILEYVRHT